MRLDKYLKVSRLIKRRTVADDACRLGRVSVNGISRKSGYQVQPGDHIEILFAGKKVAVEVLSVEEPRGRTGADELYRFI